MPQEGALRRADSRIAHTRRNVLEDQRSVSQSEARLPDVQFRPQILIVFFVDSLLMWRLLSLAPPPYHLLGTLT